MTFDHRPTKTTDEKLRPTNTFLFLIFILFYFIYYYFFFKPFKTRLFFLAFGNLMHIASLPQTFINLIDNRQQNDEWTKDTTLQGYWHELKMVWESLLLLLLLLLLMMMMEVYVLIANQGIDHSAVEMHSAGGGLCCHNETSRQMEVWCIGWDFLLDHCFSIFLFHSVVILFYSSDFVSFFHFLLSSSFLLFITSSP